jgi:hypothetical protein
MAEFLIGSPTRLDVSSLVQQTDGMGSLSWKASLLLSSKRFSTRCTASECVTLVFQSVCSYTCRISEDPPISTKEGWESVLKLSHIFGFASMRTLAIGRLSSLTSSIDRIVLAHDYGVDSWLPQAYLDVCEARSLPPPEEAHRIGFDTYIKVTAAREALRPSSALVNIVNRPRVIANIFGLPLAHGCEPSDKPDASTMKDVLGTNPGSEQTVPDVSSTSSAGSAPLSSVPGASDDADRIKHAPEVTEERVQCLSIDIASSQRMQAPPNSLNSISIVQSRADHHIQTRRRFATATCIAYYVASKGMLSLSSSTRS